ncbi:hypothetical protein K6Q96_06815 [Grimontia kaedaensis]|uniref:Uncharacterized protein n=1 Tax=Grimontia kaedaensis TaxID=2872157 RepID=A0ABY4WXJ8_9GAMM|nr:hypothetical protein [Grimontia kaedaensis]USH03698.1 hypothetical protein K6Q96_06815 [Grimontia kaedaensis]
MPAIRIQHNAVTVVITAPKAFLQCVSHQEHLPAKVKSGGMLYFPFGGFVEREKLNKDAQFVKLLSIDGYSEADDGSGPWKHFPHGIALLGVFREKTYYLVLERGKVVRV